MVKRKVFKEDDQSIRRVAPEQRKIVLKASPRPVAPRTKEEVVVEVEPARTMVTTHARMAKSFLYSPDHSGGIRPPIPYEPEPIVRGDVYVGRDKFEKVDVNPVKLVSEEPVSTFSIDVDTASYAFVRRAINNGSLPQKNAVRIEELINYFDYDYELPKDKSKPFKPTVAVYQTPWNPDTKLLHIGIKGYDIVPEKKPKSNLVFLIDTSGSMGSPDKLPLLKNSFRMLVESLSPEDTVAIVVYAGSAGKVLEPTKVKEKGKILEALEKLHSGGSTAGGAGIRLAYALAEANFDKNSVNRVILATDGDFNVGITNQEELKGFVERKRKTGIYLSVLGFGQGNYNDALMQKLAQNGNGNASYIDSLSEAQKVLVDEASSTLFTIAKDVKIQIEFNPASVAEYRLIGYETRMLKREDFKNDKVDAGDIGSGHSVTAIYEITPPKSKARLIDELRYKKAQPAVSKPQQVKGPEYAFLKIRYKLPDSDKSTLLTAPVTDKNEYTKINTIPGDIRFAAAVAAFGQLLRGDPYTKDFTFENIIELAEPVRGKDKFGYRNEFLRLVRLAKSSPAMKAQ
jgi:Ca-activated chloride channel family protein